MKHCGAVLAVLTLCSTFAQPLAAQAAQPAPEAPPNAPHVVKSVQAPGLDLRFLDFKWDPEAFTTLQQGGTHPAGQRSWVLARLILTRNPLRCAGKIIPVGASLLILNPARGNAGPTLELRSIDLREIFVDMNVVAEPPPGETYYQGPAEFRQVGTTAGRLEINLAEQKDGVEVIVHYGDREARLTLTR